MALKAAVLRGTLATILNETLLVQEGDQEATQRCVSGTASGRVEARG